MSQKKIWLSWIGGEQSPALAACGQSLADKGLDVQGGPWVDNLDKQVWAQMAQVLRDGGLCDAWVIAVEENSWQSASVRYGVSALRAMMAAERPDFAVFVLAMDFKWDEAQQPTPLADAIAVEYADEAWAAKIVAKLFRAAKAAEGPYRMTVKANSAFGQWYEVGPREGEWSGILFGVSEEGKITHHGVGESGTIPNKCVLEYPVMGIEANVSGRAFSACSVQNKLEAGQSYFIKVEGAPSHIIFGGHPGTDAEEVYVLRMS